MVTRKYSFVFVTCLFAVAGCGEAPQQMSLVYPDSSSDGAKILVDNCSGCHAAPLPSVHPAEQWRGVLHRMQNRMRMKAHRVLSDEEFEMLAKYMERNAAQ